MAAVLAGGGAQPAPAEDYWSWYEKGAPIAGRLGNPALIAAWELTGTLHQEFLQAAQAAVAAAARKEGEAAHRHLDRMLVLSSELTGLVVGSSLSELMAAIGRHEKQLAARYEHDFLEAAQMGRFAVRLPEGALIETDGRFAGFLGYAPEDLAGRPVSLILDDAAWAQVRAVVAGGGAPRVAVKARHRDGHVVALEVIAYPESDEGGQVLRGFAADITRSESEAQQQRLLSTAIEVSDHVIMITNDRQEIVYANPAFTKLTGYKVEDVIGKTPHFLQGPETSEATRLMIREGLTAGHNVHAEVLNYAKEGWRYWVDLSIGPVTDGGGAITHYIAIEHDITERKAAEQEIVRIALADHLTGLSNRRAAEDRLLLEWNRARRSSGTFALAIADIDRFKLINDQYGHHVGDETLKHVADLLAANLRGGDWAARWGGEEFLLCFHDLDHRGAVTAAERMRKLIKANPIKVSQGELPVTISMGVALYEPNYDGIDAMLAQADALLYEAKHSGRDKVFCSGGSKSRNKGSVIWEGTQVQSALQEGRLVPAFQPIVDLRTGEEVADEALARIRAKDGRLVPAFDFVHAAEALHLISAVDMAISMKAMSRCACLGRKRPSTAGCVRFVNLSPQFLANADQVEALLMRADEFRHVCMGGSGAVKQVVIEITERHGGDVMALKKNLQPLLDFGFRLALDDFGNGNSSFRFLAELPVDFLKIEGWMVSRVKHDPRVRQLVETIVGTAQKFNATTVAEWVEDAQTAQMLRDMGVDLGQGYHFGKPVVDEEE
ncbi:MAG: EAL domain-containing protein [Pseudomonadota bacterium]